MPDVPSSVSPVLDGQGYFTSAWYRFLSGLTARPGPISPVVVGPSPFTWAAPSSGTLLIQGGTVSQVRISRGRVLYNFTAGGQVPVSFGDSVIITYSVAPTLTFIPG